MQFPKIISYCDYFDCIYSIDIEIEDTENTVRSASYLNIHLDIYSDDRLRTKLYDKRDYLNFPIVYFPFICSNIPPASV